LTIDAAAEIDYRWLQADGFRNYRSTPHELIDRAHLLGLTAPEMTVLVAGMRVLNTSSTTSDESNYGVLTTQPETLTNDFLVNLLDMSTQWSEASPGKFEGKEAAGAVKWTATSADLVFGSNPELRAIAEHYACDDAADEFVQHFVLAFAKVMNNDRFDLAA
jgi:catalase-peroxidase